MMKKGMLAAIIAALCTLSALGAAASGKKSLMAAHNDSVIATTKIINLDDDSPRVIHLNSPIRTPQ